MEVVGWRVSEEYEGIYVGRDFSLLGLEVNFQYPDDKRGRMWLPFRETMHLLYGKNGVGKSTVIGAVRAALTGLADQRILAPSVRLYARIGPRGSEVLQFLSSQPTGVPRSWTIEDDRLYSVIYGLNEEQDDDESDPKSRLEEQDNFDRRLGNFHPGLVRSFALGDWYQISFASFAYEDYQRLLARIGLGDFHLTEEQLIRGSWESDVPTLPTTRAAWLAWALNDGLSIDETRSGTDLVERAFNEVGLDNLYCLQPIGNDQVGPRWGVSLATDRRSGSGVIGDVINATDAAIDEWRNEYFDAEGITEPTDDDVRRWLELSGESDGLNRTGPSPTFVEWDDWGVQFMKLPNPCPYVCLNDPLGHAAHVDAEDLGLQIAMVDLDGEFDVVRWFREAVSRTLRSGSNVTETDSSREGREGIAVDLTLLSKLDELLQAASADVRTFEVGIGGVRRTTSSSVGDWLDGNGVKLEVLDAPTDTWTDVDRLSPAQSLVLGIVLRVHESRLSAGLDITAEEPRAPIVVLGDEVDSGMHVTLIGRLYGYLQANSRVSFLATHSPSALSLRLPHRVHVRRGAGGRLELAEWSVSSDFTKAAETWGVDRPHLLAAIPGFIVVEGPHDKVALDVLLDSSNVDARSGIRPSIVPAMGHKGMPGMVEMNVLLGLTDVPIVIVVDNGRSIDFEKLRTDAMVHRSAVKSPDKVLKALSISTLRDGATPEERTMLELMTLAIQNDLLDRVHVVTLDKPDIIQYVSPKEFNVTDGTWDSLVTEWRKTGNKASFKDWLRAKKDANISTNAVKRAFERLDHLDGSLSGVIARIDQIFHL